MGNDRHTIGDDSELCYLEAGNVELPAGKLADLQLCSRDDQTLGAVEGVLIEPSARRVRYFVVRRSGWLRNARYLLPLENLAHVDGERNVLQIDACADDVPRQQFDPSAVRPFSDDDLLTVLFPPTAA